MEAGNTGLLGRFFRACGGAPGRGRGILLNCDLVASGLVNIFNQLLTIGTYHRHGRESRQKTRRPAIFFLRALNGEHG